MTTPLPLVLAADSHIAMNVALALSALLGTGMLLIIFSVSRSMRILKRAADRMAQGDLSARVRVRGPLQITALAATFNSMAGQLQDRLSTVVQQRNELGTVLSSMKEGVLAIDLDERIISLNKAAADLMRLQPGWAIGRSLQEVVRSPALQTFATRTLDESRAIDGEFVLRSADESGSERHLQVQSATLLDASGDKIGAVFVLHDITRIRRLEQVRKDFVANVSHEIRTPVAAIKAAVETVLTEMEAEQQARGEQAEPDQASRFMGIIARQSDRLESIVEDLLALARIEQGTGEIFDELEPGRIGSVLSAASETLGSRAAEKDIEITVTCDPDLRMRMNHSLLEQAVTNLIDNAIKYSDEGTAVLVAAEQTASEVVISVSDHGRGIEPEHLPRVFERFYRTDKARSRALGGTGLGLSIVKHVAEAHGGRVSADSQFGRGSTFRIHLPRAAEHSEAGEPDTEPPKPQA